MDFKVQFYAVKMTKYVTISNHRKLNNAVKNARKSKYDDGYDDVSILTSGGIRLDAYGSKCYFCNDSICEGSMDNGCQK